MTRQSPLPGPFPLPFIGNVLERDLGKLAKRCQKKYGDMFELYIGNQRTIWLCRADLVEKIHSSSTKSNFKLRNKNQQGLEEMDLSNGITMNNDLESWSFNRKFLINAALSPSFLKSFTINLVKENYFEMKNYWYKLNSEYKKVNTGKGNGGDDDYIIDISSWLSRLSMDITLRTMTGKKESENIVESLHRYVGSIIFFYFVPKFLRLYTPIRFINDSLLNSNAKLKKHLLGIVKERRKEIETMNGSDDVTFGNDMLTCLININTERDLERKNISEDDELYNGYARPMTDEEISEIVLEVFVANQDTTPTSLSFIIYHLCKYPEYKTRLINEILSAFPPDSTSIDSINYENLEKLKFLEAFIHEVARISPAIPALMRTSTNKDTINGYEFPGHTAFYTYYHGIHMHPKHWENPEKFYPDRFLKDGDNNGGRGIEKNSFLQFGGGIRMCPGRHFAMLFMKIFLVMFFRDGNDIELVVIPLTCSGHTRPVVHLQFSPITDGTYYLISACKDGNPMLRDGPTGDWIGTFMGHKGAVWSAKLSKDASRAVTASADFTAKVWDTYTGDVLFSFTHGHIVRSADISDDGTRIVSGGQEKKLRLYDLNKPDEVIVEIEGHESTIKSVIVDGERNVVLSAGDDKEIRLANSFKTEHPITSMELSADGKYITCTAGKIVYFLDAATYRVAKSIATAYDVSSVSLHPDHKRFVAGGSNDLWVRIYDFESGKELEVYKGHHGPIHTVSYSPDGEIYATGSEDGTIRLWQTTPGKSYGLWQNKASKDEKENDVNGIPTD
ncbi:12842_t:CDS:10 [Entrophospora sp. SA101]|nr:12842_t:CDS:10 [Entrophospora sp. SA101]